MKKTTIFDYLPKSIIQKENQLELSKETNPVKKSVKYNQNQERLVKSLIQKSLAQVIEEQEDYNNICKLLDNSWKKEQNNDNN